MEERYVIDTSAIIKYLNKSFPEPGQDFVRSFIDTNSCISIISKIELLGWDGSDKDLKITQIFIDNSVIIQLADNIIDQTILIRREFKLKLPDAIIAATALALDYTLVADNDKDFQKVKNLKYINPKTIISI